MSKISLTDRKIKQFTFLNYSISFILLLFHIVMLFLLPTNNFDTNEIMRTAIFLDRDLHSLSDIAHPFGLFGLVWLLRFFIFFNFAPRLGWFVILSLAFLCNLFLIKAACKIMGTSAYKTSYIVLLYLASQIIHDFSSRGEENLIFHGLFFMSIALFCSSKKNKLLLLLLINTLIGLMHIQPFSIIMISCAVFLIIRNFRIRLSPTNFGEIWQSFIYPFLMCVGLPILILFLSGHFAGLRYVAYHKIAYSIFSAHNISEYIYTFFCSAYQFFSFKIPPWIVAGNCFPGGAILILLVFLLIFRNLKDNLFSGLVCILAILFVLLYEPANSQRWDTFLLSLLALFVASKISLHSIPGLTLTLLPVIFLPAVCLRDICLINRAAHEFKRINLVVGNFHKIYTAPIAARDLVSRIPLNVRICNLKKMPKNEINLLYLPEVHEVTALKNSGYELSKLKPTSFYIGTYKKQNGKQPHGHARGTYMYPPSPNT